MECNISGLLNFGIYSDGHIFKSVGIKFLLTRVMKVYIERSQYLGCSFFVIKGGEPPPDSTREYAGVIDSTPPRHPIMIRDRYHTTY